jgi:hypothetical protein
VSGQPTVKPSRFDLDVAQTKSTPPSDAGPSYLSTIPGKLENATGATLRGVASGVPFANDIRALTGTGLSYGRDVLSELLGGVGEAIGPSAQSGEPFSQRYGENLARARALEAKDVREQPVASIAGQIAGGASLPVGGGISSLPRAVGGVDNAFGRVATSPLVIGGGYGAAYGAGTGDSLSDRASNAVTGAEYGAGFGQLGAWAGRGLESLGNKANSFIRPSAGADTSAMGAIAAKRPGEFAMGPEDVAAANAAGQPVVAGDIGGEAARRLARSTANSSPEAAAILKTPLIERTQDRAQRFGDYLKGVMGTDLNNTDALAAINADGRSVNTPAYRKAFVNNPAIWNDDLANIIQSPDMKKAVGSANDAAVTEAIINKQPIVRNPFVTDKNGNLSLATDPDGTQAIPSLQYWDTVKRQLDSAVSGAYKGPDPGQAVRLSKLRDYLVDTLDQAAPDYANARAGGWATIQARNSLDAGAKLFGMTKNMDINDVYKMLANPNITDDMREAAAQGFAGQMLSSASGQTAGRGRNVANMFDNEGFQEKAHAVLGEDRANQIEAWLRREQMMDAFKNKVVGNSTTAEQGSDQAHNSIWAHVLTAPLAGAGAGAGEEFLRNGFDPLAIAKGALTGAFVGGVGGAARGMQTARMTALAQKLVSDDPHDISAALQAVSHNPEMMSNFRQFTQQILPKLTAEGGAKQLEKPSQEPVNAGQIMQHHAKGGRVERPSHEFLVQRLIKLAERAKRDEKRATAPILKFPDDAVTYALALANKYI